MASNRKSRRVNEANEVRERRTKRRNDPGASASTSRQPFDSSCGFLFEHNEAEVVHFNVEYLPRRIQEPVHLDSAWFTNQGFTIAATLEASHLRQLSEITCPFSERMVKAFYKNLIYTDQDLRSRVCGIDIMMTTTDWADLLGYDFDADETSTIMGPEKTITLLGYDRASVVDAVLRDNVELANHASFNVKLLTVEGRILHYIMTHGIFPRVNNHAKVLENDLVVMWALMNGANVNWRHYICSLMVATKRKKLGHLTHACLIQKILERFQIPMGREQMKNPAKWNNKFGGRLFEHCGFHKINGLWQWKTGPPAADIAPNVGANVGHADDLADQIDFDDVGLNDVPPVENANEDPSNLDILNYLREMRNEQRRSMRLFRVSIETRLQGITTRLNQLELGRATEEEDDEEEDDDEDTV